MDKIKLSQEIELLREQLHKIVIGKALTDEKVIKVSQELDILLVKYQYISSFDMVR